MLPKYVQFETLHEWRSVHNSNLVQVNLSPQGRLKEGSLSIDAKMPNLR
jgi:hypothetical protein